MARRRLRDALLDVAKRVEKEQKFTGNQELCNANASVVKMFSTPDPVVRQVNGRRRNITVLALWRADRYLRRNGIDWPNFNWESLLKWLYENWDKILRVLLSLLVLI